MAKQKTVVYGAGRGRPGAGPCAAKTSSLYAFNDWMDANIFFTMGKSMLSGKVLYRDVFRSQRPGAVSPLRAGVAAGPHGLYRRICAGNLRLRGVFLGLGCCARRNCAANPCTRSGPVPAAAVAACRAFSHGGSAEELLPFLAAALYGLVSMPDSQQTNAAAHRSPARFLCRLCVAGSNTRCWAFIWPGWPCWRCCTCAGAGCGSWAEAVSLTWAAWRWQPCPGLPSTLGAHHALDAWWECYFYDNLFLYKGDGRSALTLAQHLWWAVRDDLPACLPAGGVPALDGAF